MKTSIQKKEQNATLNASKKQTRPPMNTVGLESDDRASIREILSEQTLQAKLKIGAPNDKYEQEADRVADEIMRMPDPRVQSAAQGIEEEPVQLKSIDNFNRQMIQPPHTPIQSLKGSGQPLANSERAFFEPRFGADFSHVQLHTDYKAASMADSISAKAFTTGRHVVFGTGQYAPETHTGVNLLAHELTHVIQQRRSSSRYPSQLAKCGLARMRLIPTIQAKLTANQPGDKCEQETDPRIGGTSSGTTPPYTIREVKERLSGLNQGPIRGSDLVNVFDTDRWRIFFWKTEGNTGLTEKTEKLILLPREASLFSNVNTLFHESIHITQPVPRSTGSPSDPEAVWANLEEEVKANYQEILFLRAHAKDDPSLVAAAEAKFPLDWAEIEKMDTGQLYRFFQESVVPDIVVGHINAYRVVTEVFDNDITRVANSPRVESILDRVILGWKPGKLQEPSKPSRPSLIPIRKDFRKEILDSIKGL